MTCLLCEAARITPWHYEDEHCWIADCEVCDVPMVVWTGHGPTPPEEIVAHMIARLTEVADQVLGDTPYRVDQVMRQIPDHFHAHARTSSWWFKV